MTDVLIIKQRFRQKDLGPKSVSWSPVEVNTRLQDLKKPRSSPGLYVPSPILSWYFPTLSFASGIPVSWSSPEGPVHHDDRGR